MLNNIGQPGMRTAILEAQNALNLCQENAGRANSAAEIIESRANLNAVQAANDAIRAAVLAVEESRRRELAQLAPETVQEVKNSRGSSLGEERIAQMTNTTRRCVGRLIIITPRSY